VADRIRQATAARRPILLRGVTMGGGPCHWAAMDHLRAGLTAFATPDAARTFDDDLDAVREMGFQVVSEDEADQLTEAETIALRDVWLDEILATFSRFGVPTEIDRMAVAAFDHGAAPPGYSDRVFRFDYLTERLLGWDSLAAFAFPREHTPERLSRLRAVAQTVAPSLPLLLMDTAPAAILGALEDPIVSKQAVSIVANVGNFHCLAFRLVQGHISGLFEHHTGEVSPGQLESLIVRLARGTLTNDEVFHSKGHGAVVFDPAPRGDAMPPVAVVGPRRGMLRGSRLAPYEAVPHGDMMLAGCFGLLRAYALRDPEVREVVERRMGRGPRWQQAA
jgi:uncharacterized protein (DUF1786 family)